VFVVKFPALDQGKVPAVSRTLDRRSCRNWQPTRLTRHGKSCPAFGPASRGVAPASPHTRASRSVKSTPARRNRAATASSFIRDASNSTRTVLAASSKPHFADPIDVRQGADGAHFGHSRHASVPVGNIRWRHSHFLPADQLKSNSNRKSLRQSSKIQSSGTARERGASWTACRRTSRHGALDPVCWNDRPKCDRRNTVHDHAGKT